MWSRSYCHPYIWQKQHQTKISQKRQRNALQPNQLIRKNIIILNKRAPKFVVLNFIKHILMELKALVNKTQ